MQGIQKTARAATVLLLAALIAACSLVLPGMTTKAEAKSGLTSIGLAEHALKAYRDGWLYSYGGYGNFNANGVRTSDCSGLIYSYFCWVDDNSNIQPDWNYPRTVTAQANASSVSGPIDTIPRTHGLIVTIANYDHVGVYVGNNMVVDNSTWGVNMRYESIPGHGWIQWHKLDCITYPTNGWYKFDGDYFYYENGEYIINTTRTIDGVTYTFGSDGVSNKTPGNASNDGYENSASGFNAKTTAGVRLREGPGLNYNTLTVLAEGTGVHVTSTKNPEWYAVTTGSGQKGYIFSEYIHLTGSVPDSGEDDDSSADTPIVSGESARTTTGVHLRSGRGTNYSSLGVIPGGTAITVTDKSDSAWYGVTVNGKSGYMFSEYIKLDSSTSGGSSSGSTSTGSDPAVTTADVHLRSGRGTNYSSKGVIGEGTAITVTDTSNSNWYGVTVNGKSGYMFSAYIRLTGSANTGNSSSDSGSSSSGNASSGSESIAARTTTYVNLRSGRGTNYSVLDVIPTGTAITVTDRSNSDWYGVTVNGKSGYMFSTYIQTAITAAVGDTMTTTAYLNLRQGPGTDTAVLLVIPEGGKVTVEEKTSAAWYKVSYIGKTGYVSTDYIQ